MPSQYARRDLTNLLERIEAAQAQLRALNPTTKAFTASELVDSFLEIDAALCLHVKQLQLEVTRLEQRIEELRGSDNRSR